MITLGKRGDLHALHLYVTEIASESYDEATDKYTSLLFKLFSEIAPRYAERNGGYTRILKQNTSLAMLLINHRTCLILSILLSVMMME